MLYKEMNGFQVIIIAKERLNIHLFMLVVANSQRFAQSRTQSLRSFWQGRVALDNADETCDMIGLCCFLPQYPNASSIVARISNEQ